jgi:type VI secretion system protein ImpK
MNKSEISQLNVSSTRLADGQPAAGRQEVRDGEGLYRRACRLVQEAKAALTEAGYSDISRDHMVYTPVCTA